MELRIRIADLMKEVGSSKDVEVAFDKPEISVGELLFRLPEALVAELSITNAEESFLVRGSLKGIAEISCSRCLSPAKIKIEIKIEEEVLSIDEIESDDADGLPDSYSHDYDSIDLSPMIEQTLIIDLPAVPLCKNDCAGLCPVCGLDRNLDQCDCELERTDPRWDALNSLKLGMSE